MYISERESNKNYNQDQKKYSFINTYFTNNIGNIGGALHFDNPQNVYISNCIFQKNRAENSTKIAIKDMSGSGGGIYYTCNQDYLNCRLELANTNVFENNYAAVKGGAINWDVLEPVFSSSTTFNNNFAQQYGNDIGSFALKLV